MRNIGRIVWGFVLVLFGLVWAGNIVGLFDVNLFFKGWWTLFIIIPCLINLINPNSSKLGNLIGVLIGVILLLATREVISMAIIIKLLLPVLIVIIGLSLMFGNKIRNKVTEKTRKINKDTESITATFGENIVKKDKENFDSANLDAVFGKVVLDLGTAKIKDEAVIKASAIFGAVQIIVPKDVQVKIKSTPIFGGIKNKRAEDDAKVTIYVDAFALFGGVDIV